MSCTRIAKYTTSRLIYERAFKIHCRKTGAIRKIGTQTPKPLKYKMYNYNCKPTAYPSRRWNVKKKKKHTYMSVSRSWFVSYTCGTKIQRDVYLSRYAI